MVQLPYSFPFHCPLSPYRGPTASSLPHCFIVSPCPAASLFYHYSLPHCCTVLLPFSPTTLQPQIFSVPLPQCHSDHCITSSQSLSPCPTTFLRLSFNASLWLFPTASLHLCPTAQLPHYLTVHYPTISPIHYNTVPLLRCHNASRSSAPLPSPLCPIKCREVAECCFCESCCRVANIVLFLMYRTKSSGVTNRGALNKCSFLIHLYSKVIY
jgi:hypothetical protein